ncbi:flavanone 3-dioxygenase 2-like [Lycium ferocissimum]|uniref:flavanone 3-dioxygenase 2-like n=1 Tax=Lycium ferocissimum TaxID=112874 RepID=UPI002815B428|nr:flavanone 3-dioxygenase 2-like [Lycium ferocissimum]
MTPVYHLIFTVISQNFGRAKHISSEASYSSNLEATRRLGVSQGNEWPCQFRINKYHFTPEAVGSSGVQIHTDSGFLTILQDDENVGGLEVMKKSGEFVAVDPWPNTLLVNLGDIGAIEKRTKQSVVNYTCVTTDHPAITKFEYITPCKALEGLSRSLPDR